MEKSAMENGYPKRESARHGIEIEFPRDVIDQVEINQVTEADLTAERGRRDGFIPHRIVANIVAPKVSSLPNQANIILRIYFNFEDLKYNNRLNVAYWREETWNLFDQLAVVQCYPLPGNLVWAGYFEITFHNHENFDKFGDPPVAIGR